jgi:hypothetical protein
MTAQPAPLSPREVAAALGATSAIVQAEFAGLPESLLRYRPGPEEWCVLETVGHLIEAERRGFAGRIRHILSEHDHVCITWEPPDVARARRDHERAPAAVLAEFVDQRNESVALVAGLREADLTRGGRHPQVGRLTVNDLLHEWVHHDQEHLRQLLATIQRAVWPSMGNAQRFSQP